MKKYRILIYFQFIIHRRSLSRSEAQSARNAKSWPQPIPYLLPIPPPLCDMVSRDFPSPFP
jgi:hypothetical protein